MSSMKHDSFLQIYRYTWGFDVNEHITVRNFTKSRVSLNSPSGVNNAAAEKKKRGGAGDSKLNAACPRFFFYFPVRLIPVKFREKSARWYSTNTRSAREPRLHANNAIKRFEYRPDNALSTANSQPFLPLVPRPLLRFAWKAGFQRRLDRRLSLKKRREGGRVDGREEGRERGIDSRLWSIRWRGINRDTREVVRSKVKFNLLERDVFLN